MLQGERRDGDASINSNEQKLHRQSIMLPTIIAENEPVWHQIIIKSSAATWIINWDQDGRRLGLK